MLLEDRTTEEVLGAFFVVYRELGFGFLEGIYINALAVELERRGLSVKRETAVEVFYSGVPVGRYRLDMTVENRVLIEAKASKTLSPADERQLLNYLKATNYEVGLLLHFGPTPSFKRLVYANQRKRSLPVR